MRSTLSRILSTQVGGAALLRRLRLSEAPEPPAVEELAVPYLEECRMPPDHVWVGVDLGEKRMSVCVVDDDGAPIHEQECDTTLEGFEEALQSFPLPRIALIGVEAGNATHLIRRMRTLGYPIAMFEARKASRFLAIRRSKTDASDARGLADLARLGRSTVSQVHLKSVEVQELRSELVLRHKLVRVRLVIEAVIRSRLRLHGRRLKRTTKVGAFLSQVQAHATLLLDDEGFDLGPQLVPLAELCEALRAYSTSMDRSLAKRAREHAVCGAFLDIPGVGPITALSFYSAIEDPHRFERVADVGAYLGLVPRRHQSGNASRSAGITKTGNQLTRYHLMSAAMSLRLGKQDCALRDWGAALTERIGGARARVAVARKLAILMLVLWRTGRPFVPYPDGSPGDAEKDDPSSP